MSKRTDAVRKVQGLVTLATNPAATDGERRNAEDLAVKIRLKYGIGDAELEAALDADPDLEILGFRIGHYSRHVKPHVERIRDEIDTVLAIAKQDNVRAEAETLCHFFKDLSLLLDNDSSRAGLKQARNRVVKALYMEHFEDYKKLLFDEGSDWGGDNYQDLHCHKHAIFYTKLHADLRSDVIERIVGRSEKGIWTKIHEAHEAMQQAEEAKVE